MTIKEAKLKLCTNCSHYPRQMRNFPGGVDDDGHIIYKQWARKCSLNPITEDKSECPYYKELQQEMPK